MPTILAILNLEQPEALPGINVLDRAKLEARKAVFGEIYAHDFNTVEESIFYKMAITNPYKIIFPDKLNKPGEKIQLYNIYEDPFEKVNLAESKPEKILELKKMIEESWKLD